MPMNRVYFYCIEIQLFICEFPNFDDYGLMTNHIILIGYYQNGCV